jgi:hypothetical protein
MKKNGIYDYRGHNFNIIPIKLDSTGKKINNIKAILSIGNEARANVL